MRTARTTAAPSSSTDSASTCTWPLASGTAPHGSPGPPSHSEAAAAAPWRVWASPGRVQGGRGLRLPHNKAQACVPASPSPLFLVCFGCRGAAVGRPLVHVPWWPQGCSLQRPGGHGRCRMLGTSAEAVGLAPRGAECVPRRCCLRPHVLGVHWRAVRSEWPGPQTPAGALGRLEQDTLYFFTIENESCGLTQ